jgi:2-deoxy-D-gluconate 3-dehydrogenase
LTSPASFDLTGKVAVVTGAKRGIGFAMATALAAAGADIIGVSASLEGSGSDIERAVTALGRSFEAHAVDFADPAAVQAFAVDILVNNAGTIRRAPAVDHSDADFDHVVAVNLRSQFVLAREFGRPMVARGHGKIIFTASLLSFQGGINVVGYAAAKSGVAGLIHALSNEWAGSGVTVNGIFGRRIWETWEVTRRLLGEGMVDVGPMITHRMALDDVEEAMQLLQRGDCGKIVMYPGGVPAGNGAG